MLAINSVPFALNVLTGALLTVVAPIQVEDLLRRSGLTAAQVAADKGGALALVVASGAIIAVLTPLIVGALSDRCTSRLGRRRPYMIGGFLGALVGLAIMAVPPSLAVYIAGYFVTQAGSNTAGAASSGIIPDLVPERQRGQASGWFSMMSILGNITGLLLGSVGLARSHADDLLRPGQEVWVYGSMMLILVIFLLVAATGVREVPLAGPVPRITWIHLIESLWISPRKYPDFTWAWLTRFAVNMGFNTVQFYLLYFLQDVVGAPRDKIANDAAFMFLGLLLSGAMAASVSGPLSDRLGRKPLIYLAVAILSCSLAAFIVYNAVGTIALPGPFAPVFNTIFYLGIGFGFGFGAYQAVDWALGTDVLPDKKDAAKDMGVWHIAQVLPQSLATVIAGTVLTSAASAGMGAPTRYSLIFGMAIVYFTTGALLVRKVRHAR